MRQMTQVSIHAEQSGIGGERRGMIFVRHCFCITYTQERRLPIIAAITKREQWNWPMARQWPKQKWAKSRTKTTIVSFLRLPTTKSRHRKHWEYSNSPWYFFLWFASIYVWWWNETTVSCVDLPTYNHLTTRRYFQIILRGFLFCGEADCMYGTIVVKIHGSCVGPQCPAHFARAIILRHMTSPWHISMDSAATLSIDDLYWCHTIICSTDKWYRSYERYR